MDLNTEALFLLIMHLVRVNKELQIFVVINISKIDAIINYLRKDPLWNIRFGSYMTFITT